MARSRKRAPNISDPELNRIIQDVYKELNLIEDRILSPIATIQTPSEGQPGDIRLYEDTSSDGGSSYYLQGKFKDAWASVNLSLQSTSSENLTFLDNNTLEDSTSYITLEEAKALVNYSNLNANSSVGTGEFQVAQGNHGHSHLVLDDIGTVIHSDIDNHVSAGISDPTAAVDAEVHSVSGNVSSDVSLTATSAGSATAWARSDHRHKLNEDIVPTWTGIHTHTAKVAVSYTHLRAHET